MTEVNSNKTPFTHISSVKANCLINTKKLKQ